MITYDKKGKVLMTLVMIVSLIKHPQLKKNNKSEVNYYTAVS